MIRYLKHEAIDKKKWDRFITSSSNGIVYAMSWYLDIVSPGWDALVEDDFKSAFPVTHNKKYGIAYLRQPLFTQQLGVFKEDSVSDKLITEYLKVISSQFKFIEINLNASNQFTSADFKINERLTHHIDLNNNYESLYKSYSDNLKRNISKAGKFNVLLDFDADENEIVKLFRRNRGRTIAAVKSTDYLVLLNLVKEARKSGSVKVIGARTPDGRLCAGAIFIFGLKEIIFLFSGTSEEAKKNGAMSLIIDHVIKSNAQKDLTFDFDGSMDKNLARFYKSFGSKEAVYLRIQKNNLPKFVRWIKN